VERAQDDAPTPCANQGQAGDASPEDHRAGQAGEGRSLPWAAAAERPGERQAHGRAAPGALHQYAQSRKDPAVKPGVEVRSAPAPGASKCAPAGCISRAGGALSADTAGGEAAPIADADQRKGAMPKEAI
jgi:hypothetical protein